MKINKLKAFTIIEVLVASVVVSIIMLGVITTSISLSNSAKFSSANYFVSQNTQSALNQIIAQASIAIGTPSNPGFVGVDNLIDKDETGADVVDDSGDVLTRSSLTSGSSNSFCIRQNFSVDGDYSSSNPIAYNRWACFTFNPSNYNLYSCYKPFDINRLPGSVAYVANAASQPGDCKPSDWGYTLVGTAKVKPVTSLTINAAGGGSQKVIYQVTIDNCLDPSEHHGFGVCTAVNSNNPYVEKTGIISPTGHSGS